MKKMKKRSFVFYIALAVMLSLPLASSAQNGFLGHGAEMPNQQNGFMDREGEGGPSFPGLGNQGFEQDPVPVGSGVLMLIAAGAGYAVLKMKKNQK